MTAFPKGAALIFGASGGIGGIVARVLAEDGADLALVYNSKRETAETIADDTRAMSRTVSLHQCDVTDREALARTVKEAVEAHGHIHSLVWAAGPLVEQIHLVDTPAEDWRNAFAVETQGLIDAIATLIPHMREQGGSIVHLGSAGHRRFPPRDGLSVVPKAANEAFLKGIAREEGRHGIRANSVLVGVIEAGMFKELTEKGAFPPDWVEETQKGLCLKRWGQPEEIGDAVSFLASNRSAYITGQTLEVSGGYGV